MGAKEYEPVTPRGENGQHYAEGSHAAERRPEPDAPWPLSKAAAYGRRAGRTKHVWTQRNGSA
jgi:hypothetical protein